MAWSDQWSAWPRRSSRSGLTFAPGIPRPVHLAGISGKRFSRHADCGSRLAASAWKTWAEGPAWTRAGDTPWRSTDFECGNHAGVLADFLVVDAVLRNRSPVVQFPAPLPGKEQGFLSRKRPFPPEAGPKSAIKIQLVAGEIPYNWSCGNSSSYQRTVLNEQKIPRARSARPLVPVRGPRPFTSPWQNKQPGVRKVFLRSLGVDDLKPIWRFKCSRYKRNQVEEAISHLLEPT